MNELLVVLGMNARVSYKLRVSHSPNDMPILSFCFKLHAQGFLPSMVLYLAKLLSIIPVCLHYSLPL